MATRKRSDSSAKKSARAAARRKNKGLSTATWVGIGVLAVLVLLIGAVILNQSSRSSGRISGLKTYPNLARTHTTTAVNYQQTPPAGGPHNPVWLNCGVYSEPVANENAVHSLEHGAIWITYRPDLPAEQVAELAALTRQSRYRLLSPYPNLPAPIVASAWGYQVQLDQANDPRLLAFIRAYEQNPLGPEPGASCSGGTGSPG